MDPSMSMAREVNPFMTSMNPSSTKSMITAPSPQSMNRKKPDLKPAIPKLTGNLIVEESLYILIHSSKSTRLLSKCMTMTIKLDPRLYRGA